MRASSELLSALEMSACSSKMASTPLVKRARAVKNGVVVDGLSMLLYQAARSFTLWTGREAPLAVMRAALPRAT